MRTDKIDNKKIDRLLQELDAGSCRVLLYLLEHKYAKLDELMEVLGESSHMNTLVRIKNVINPKALKILKRPIMIFEESRIDMESGENVLFSWWLTEEIEEKALLKEKKLFVDVFDEDNEVLIVLDLQGVREEDIKVNIEKKKANVSFRDSNGNEYLQQISLPSEVKAYKFNKQFQNQILSIRIPKNEE
jgi:HSP20 family molecular chaperone IbpA